MADAQGHCARQAALAGFTDAGLAGGWFPLSLLLPATAFRL